MKSDAKAVPTPGAFTSRAEIKVGMVVFDGAYELPGQVVAIDGFAVEITRPTGLTWRTHYMRLRPVTAWERRQLAAIGRLHMMRLKGIS